MIWPDQSLKRQALALLVARQGRGYSLCDAMSFVVMRAENVKDALTTDQHFDDEGFDDYWSDSEGNRTSRTHSLTSAASRANSRARIRPVADSAHAATHTLHTVCMAINILIRKGKAERVNGCDNLR